MGKRLLVWAAGAAVVITLATLSALVAAAGAPASGATGPATSAGLPLAPSGSVTPCPVPYTYTVSSGAIVTSTNLLPGSQCARCIVPLTLPFPISLYSQSYTSANVANYGVLQFATADTSLESCPPPYAQLGPALMPYWDDDIDTSWNEPCQGAYGLPCGVFTSTSGIAPNRVFNIEWRGRPWGSNHETLDYETRLYENSTTIDFVYGFGFMFGYSAFIGVQDGGSQFSSYICNVVGSYQFLTVRWTRDGPPSCPPTVTPTSTVTLTPTGTPELTPTWTAAPGSTRTPAPPTGTPAPSDTPAPTATSTSVRSPTPGATHTPTSAPASTATPCAIAFTDVFPADYYYAPVTYLYCHGVISGYSDGTFRPAGFTTRGQMTKIVVLGFGIPIWTPAPPAPRPSATCPAPILSSPISRRRRTTGSFPATRMVVSPRRGRRPWATGQDGGRRRGPRRRLASAGIHRPRPSAMCRAAARSTRSWKLPYATASSAGMPAVSSARGTARRAGRSPRSSTWPWSMGVLARTLAIGSGPRRRSYAPAIVAAPTPLRRWRPVSAPPRRRACARAVPRRG